MDLDKNRKAVRMLLQGTLLKIIAHECNTSQKQILRLKARYTRERVILILTAEGKRLLAADQEQFPFMKERKGKRKYNSARAKILRSLGRNGGV